jgi:hypothetical protein
MHALRKNNNNKTVNATTNKKLVKQAHNASTSSLSFLRKAFLLLYRKICEVYGHLRLILNSLYYFNE